MDRIIPVLMAGGLCLLLPVSMADAAPKPPKACDIKKARPANRFGSVLVPKPLVHNHPAEAENSDLLMVPDDAISTPERGKKKRKRKQTSINLDNESC